MGRWRMALQWEEEDRATRSWWPTVLWWRVWTWFWGQLETIEGVSNQENIKMHMSHVIQDTMTNNKGYKGMTPNYAEAMVKPYGWAGDCWKQTWAWADKRERLGVHEMLHCGWRVTPEWRGRLAMNMAMWEDGAWGSHPALSLAEMSILLLVFWCWKTVM